MNAEDDIIGKLIAGGLVGAALGTLISKNKSNGVAFGGLAGVVLVATYEAHLKAKETKIPMYYEKDGNLVLLQEDGIEKIIEKIDKPIIKLEKQFKLK